MKKLISYDKALQANPQSIDLWEDKAYFLFILNRVDEALEFLF